MFGVGAAILDWEGATDTVGPRCARVHRWWFYKWWSFERQQPALTLDVCGGAAAYRRTMFVELGGFDPLYRPGYYEDLDLSYRAWAFGWTVLYEPRSRAFHKTSQSMLARYGDIGKAALLYRNHVLFTVKNIGGAGFLVGFLLTLPFRALWPLLRGYRVPFFGFLGALPALPLALRRRFSASRRRVDLSAVRAGDAAPVSAPDRVVLLTTDFRPLLGGVADYLHVLADTLALQTRVTVMTSVAQNGGPWTRAYAFEPLPPLPDRRLDHRLGDGFAPIRKLHTGAFFLALRRYADRAIARATSQPGERTAVLIGIWDTAAHFWCEAARRAGVP